MIDLLRQSLTAQFQAALSMVNQCVTLCPAEHWEGKIATATFRWNAYHTLFFTDYYLTPGGHSAFELRDLHARGGDEREPVMCPGLSRDDTLAYVSICRQKAIEVLTAETPQSLSSASGFSWLAFSRLELHLYNLRHIQHHTGQLSAYLRRVVPTLAQGKGVRWARSGWA